MKFNIDTTRVLTVFLVVMVALSGAVAFGGTAAAETTSLTGDGTDTITGFEANSSNDISYDVSADGTDFDTDGSTLVSMNVSHDGDELAETSDAVSDGTAASQTLTLSIGELDDLPGDSGETVSVNVSAWGEDDGGNTTTGPTEFAADITFADGYASVVVDQPSDTEEVEPGFFASSLDFLSLGSFGDSDNETVYTYEETVGVGANETTVNVVDDSDGASEIDDRMAEKEYEDGDVITSVTVGADGKPILAFYGEANGEIVDENSTYAVYDATGEWTVTVSEDHDLGDNGELDIYIESRKYTDASADYSAADLGDAFVESANMGFWDLQSNFGIMDVFSFGLGNIVPMPFSLGGGLGLSGSLSAASLGLVVRGRRIGHEA